MEQLFTLLFQQDRYPEQLYRTCDGLLILHRKAGAEKLDKACQIAINNENYSYKFIHNILNNNMIDNQRQIPDNPLPQHPNIRGEEYYKQLNINL